MPSTSWSYEAALAWLYDRQKLGIKLGLDKVERLLDALGRPQDAFHSIHIAGTNGKGSVTRMLAAVLQRAGYATGATTSPHLVSFTERIEINGGPIATTDVATLLARIQPHVVQLDRQDLPPTFFEIVTALAFLHFQATGVQWAVVETGMGGRLDATNVLRPRLTVITNVDYDHEAQLGPTLMDIAWEKAGIMKPGVPLVTAATGQPLEALKARSHELQVPMSVIGEDYQIVPDDDALVLLRPTGQSMHRLGMAGEHQRSNAALVLAAVDALRRQGVAISDAAVNDALRTTIHPGRLETFQHPAPQGRVEVLVDGAHNIGAAHALRRHLAQRDWSGFHLITGFCADKNWQDCLDQWVPLAAHVWGVPVRNPRTLAPDTLVGHVGQATIPAVVATDFRDALQRATAAGATRILVAGSLFLAGEARAVLTGQSLEEIRGRQ